MSIQIKPYIDSITDDAPKGAQFVSFGQYLKRVNGKLFTFLNDSWRASDLTESMIDMELRQRGLQ